MEKIAISKAIDSGVWYKVNCSNFQGNFEYRFRVKQMLKVDINDVDNVENVFPNVDLDSGDLWLLKLDLTNMCKSQMDSWVISNSIHLVDNDGFKFECWSDYHFAHWSDYAVNTGIANLYNKSHNPKIKFAAAIAFYLPKDDESQYSIIINDGKLSEV